MNLPKLNRARERLLPSGAKSIQPPVSAGIEIVFERRQEKLCVSLVSKKQRCSGVHLQLNFVNLPFSPVPMPGFRRKLKRPYIIPWLKETSDRPVAEIL